MKKILIATVITSTLISSTAFAAERISLGYIYSASKSHTEIIESTKDSINVVSPTYFDLDLKGRLQVNETLDEEFIINMHNKGIKVTPFLSNHWGQKRAQKALENPEVLINEIVNAIYVYNLDGINVDLENLTVKDKDKLTNFMKLLRESLPSEKVVSIAVAPNPNRLTTTWVAAYDYAALAEYVDYMFLMTYDEHCYGGAEGAVASINFVEESLKVILEEVSKDKVVMGIPLYGRYWKGNADVGGEAIILGQVERIIKKYKLVPKYNEDTQTAKLTITVKEGEKGPYVNGKYLDEGTYNIYYDNENSIKAKLELVNEYDLLGAGVWALDNESYDMWNYYKDELNAKPYESEEEIEIRKEIEMKAALVAKMPFKCPDFLDIEIVHCCKINIRNTVNECITLENYGMKLIKYGNTIEKYDWKKKTRKVKSFA